MMRCTKPPFTMTLGQTTPALTQKNFHKSHHFNVIENTPMMSGTSRPGIGGNQRYESTPCPSLYPPQHGPVVPSWLVNEKKVLRFFGYFKETLPEVNRAPYQIRKVKIMYYLEDDTMQVSEPKTVNSGIPQGCLVSRQRIMKSPPNQHEHVTLMDLNVNQTIKLLDREYVITDCDTFTRTFLNRVGISVPDPIEVPKDPSTEIRRMRDESLLPTHPTIKDHRFGKFLENDRKVLRFFGYWDDTKSEFGDVRKLEILYHLSDDTIEIKEKLPVNSGRETNGLFLKRGKLPKDPTDLPGVGEGAYFSMLNVFGKGLKNTRTLRDRLDAGQNESKYYQEKDLQIGQILNVYGRQVVLTDCDGFTRDYYAAKYGIEEFNPLAIPSRSQKLYNPTKIKNEQPLPPFNGWGTHEDSESNCLGIELKPPHIDFSKFLNYDKLILRFGAKMMSKITENNERLFVISYYLSDDTISVHEISRRNCGFMGGEFFGKSKFFLPNQNKYSSERPKTYKSQNFYLGATVVLRDFVFKIISADIFALKFMEKHKDEYPLSNTTIILNKVREKLRPIYKDFTACYMTKVKTTEVDGKRVEFICYENFKKMLKELLEDNIVEHEIVTLCRFFSIHTKKKPQDNREMVRSVIHGEISRGLWDDFENLVNFLYHVNPNKREYVPERDILVVIRGAKLPLDPNLVKQFTEVLIRNDKNEIQVKDFLQFLDLKHHKAPPVPPVNPKMSLFDFKEYDQEGSSIDWNYFIQLINLEENLHKEGN